MLQTWHVRMERITGPFHGFFVAAYTVRTDEDFHGYAKICASRPKDPWACRPFLKVTTGMPMHSAEGALMLAEQKARDRIRELARIQEAREGGLLSRAQRALLDRAG